MLERESQIVLGLDPDLSALWAGSASTREGASPGELAGSSVLQHCRAVIDATAEACVAVKLQLARFELLGSCGRSVLGDVARHARERGLLVIADGKRGDIDVTAQAYAASLLGGLDTSFGKIDGLGADLVTVNPLMGVDAIEPFVTAARAAGSGVLVLVRTSNPGAADIEDLAVEGGGAVWERIAALVDRLGAPGVGSSGLSDVGGSGLSDVGAVIGATEPGHLARARELMGKAPFLLPGVGAQGGRVEDLAPAFAIGRAGGLISASRSIDGAYEATEGRAAGSEPAAAARAEAERLRAIAWALSDAARVR